MHYKGLIDSIIFMENLRNLNALSNIYIFISCERQPIITFLVFIPTLIVITKPMHIDVLFYHFIITKNIKHNNH
jgi:hypothetical protein